MCEQLDWMVEIKNLKWAIASLKDLQDPGSYKREIFQNATKGIECRLDWILAQAIIECKRQPDRG